MWRSGAAVIGASDAGAHLDFTITCDYPAYIIEHAVRRESVLSLEEAIHYMTAVPADLYGLRSRGRIEVGAHADLVVFDEGTFSAGPIRTRYDLPGQQGRLYSEPTGMDQVVVNGVPLAAGEPPSGSVLRRGRDTYTPRMN